VIQPVENVVGSQSPNTRIDKVFGVNETPAADAKRGGGTMKKSTVQIAIGFALAGTAVGCQSESRNVPIMTIQQANQLPASQVPRIFRDPSNPYGYPYDVHETDGLSRNPDDCNRWGCIDTGGNK
jgi:hypothetical protein